MKRCSPNWPKFLPWNQVALCCVFFGEDNSDCIPSFRHTQIYWYLLYGNFETLQYSQFRRFKYTCVCVEFLLRKYQKQVYLKWLKYCWWKKSCTTCEVQNFVKDRINYQPQMVCRISSINSMIYDLTTRRILGEFLLAKHLNWTDLSTGEFKHNWGTAEKLYKSEVLGKLFKGDGDQNGSWWH